MKQLRVSADKRHLEFSDGNPFFLLADTGWELFHRLDRDETVHYLQTRAEQKFNMIMAVALAEFNGLQEQNVYGEVPLFDLDPSQPNEKYFEHIDWVIEQCEKRDLIMGLLPTWGDKVNKRWGVGPEIFNPENAWGYGHYLGKRYKDRDVLWIMGGDRPIDNEKHLLTYRAMAEGVRDGDGGSHLMTFHPSGARSSSEHVHNEAWLDFNMIQSGHVFGDPPNWQYVKPDLTLQPRKPTLDAEPCYEDHPKMHRDRPDEPWYASEAWWTTEEVRRAGYTGVFAGACGHGYGCHPVWQFLNPKRHPVINKARTPWAEALQLPAANQMRHLPKLMELVGPMDPRDMSDADVGTRDGLDLVEGTEALQLVSSDKRLSLTYLAHGNSVSVRRANVTVRWFDPRTGALVESVTIAHAPESAAPPHTGGPDWVLVLDDAKNPALN